MNYLTDVITTNIVALDNNRVETNITVRFRYDIISRVFNFTPEVTTEQDLNIPLLADITCRANEGAKYLTRCVNKHKQIDLDRLTKIMNILNTDDIINYRFHRLQKQLDKNRNTGITLYGSKNTARVYTNNIDTATKNQIETLLNQEFCRGSKIRIMPDCHAGKGCTIGTTMTITDKIVPNLVGVDIGCGMLATKLKETNIDFGLIDSVINNHVPSGLNIHNTPIEVFNKLNDIKCNIDIDRANKSIGTLGGGNHFIEIDKDKEGCLWLVVHCGSRHLGIEVCEYYQKEGLKRLKTGNIQDKIKNTVKNLKEQGLEQQIEQEIQKIKQETVDVPSELAYIEGDLFTDYLHDMRITQEFAKINRQAIANTIINMCDLHIVEQFDTIHNYIDIDNMILRKGSISAQLGEKVIIPMNMRDGSLICVGKGNADWNYSAPHGAGRILSRTQAVEQVKFDDFKKSMDGIYTTSVTESTIDESPMVYKPMQEIIDNIKDTVDVIDTIKPLYNYKAH